ncbi:hypothetical protein SS50377_23249 [Spironucleus salmonicida]|uniref:Uncharacterized protein n=1 Tax=Spironucleus salmonicida TaxID=348837 RepID=A0A9P8LVZ0_9EUKA|nr:hypothetical protein SS50377_23249 [Spironucleus salmonicida]
MDQDIAIITSHLQKQYNLQESHAGQILMDFTKSKQTHSEQIRQFYETNPHIPLETSLSYISSKILSFIDHIQTQIQQLFASKDPDITILLKKQGKNVLTKLLATGEATLLQYQKISLETDFDLLQRIILDLFIKNLELQDLSILSNFVRN